jgi:hypothetical protein
MLRLCPFCGHRLGHPVEDGITTCTDCQRVFDTSPYHRVLSAAWLIRKQNLYNVEAIRGCMTCLTDCELKILERYIIEEDLPHDDFLKMINPKICFDCTEPK